MQFGIMAGHADVGRKLSKRMPGVVLHARDILILLEAVRVVDKYGYDRDAEGERQRHGDHQFDD